MPYVVPSLPLNNVGIGLLEFQNKSYLVVADFYSHYPKMGEGRLDVVRALKPILQYMVFQMK